MIKNFISILEADNNEKLNKTQMEQFKTLLRYRASFAKQNHQEFDASRIMPSMEMYKKLLSFLKSKADVSTGKAIPSAITLYNNIMGISGGEKVNQTNTIDFAGKLDDLKHKDKIKSAIKSAGFNSDAVSDKNLKMTITILANIANSKDEQNALNVDEFLKNLEDTEFLKSLKKKIESKIKTRQNELEHAQDSEKKDFSNAKEKIAKKKASAKMKIDKENFDEINDKLDDKHKEYQKQFDELKKIISKYKDLIKEKS